MAALEQRGNLHIVSAPVLIAREPQGPGRDSARLDWMCEIEEEEDSVEAGGARKTGCEGLEEGGLLVRPV